MALTFRRGDQSCERAATKVGSGDPAPQEARVDGQRRYIVAFGKIFNGLLPPRATSVQKGLKWLHHSQYHDQDHEHARNLVQDPIEPGRPHIGVGGENADAAGEVAFALFRAPDHALDRIAGSKAQPPDLRRRDIDVVGTGEVVGVGGAEESKSVLQDLDHPLADDLHVDAGELLQNCEHQLLLAHDRCVLDLVFLGERQEFGRRLLF